MSTLLYLACAIQILERDNYIFKSIITARDSFNLAIIKTKTKNNISDNYLAAAKEIINFFQIIDNLPDKLDNFTIKTINELNKHTIHNLSGIIAYAPILYSKLRYKRCYKNIKINTNNIDSIKIKQKINKYKYKSLQK